MCYKQTTKNQALCKPLMNIAKPLTLFPKLPVNAVINLTKYYRFFKVHLKINSVKMVDILWKIRLFNRTKNVINSDNCYYYYCAIFLFTDSFVTLRVPEKVCAKLIVKSSNFLVRSTVMLGTSNMIWGYSNLHYHIL